MCWARFGKQVLGVLQHLDKRVKAINGANAGTWQRRIKHRDAYIQELEKYIAMLHQIIENELGYKKYQLLPPVMPFSFFEHMTFAKTRREHYEQKRILSDLVAALAAVLPKVIIQ